GECLIDAKQFDQAVERLSPFYTQPHLLNIPGLTDRALLRLAHAWAAQQKWEESRRPLQRLLEFFPQSPLADEARYGIGWGLQPQGPLDPAIDTYKQVISRTATETGAKAQLQIGLCKMAQKKYQEAANALLAVPFTFDYPELSAAALVEAA